MHIFRTERLRFYERKWLFSNQITADSNSKTKRKYKPKGACLMYNHNIAPKHEPKIIQKNGFQLKEERIKRVYDFMTWKKEISYDDLQRAMEYGDGIMERTMKAVKSRYPHEIKWDKKTRIFTHIKKPIEVKQDKI